MRLAFWRPRPAPAVLPPAPLDPAAELRTMLYAQMVAVPARIGNGAVWVMDEEWRKKVVALAPGPAGMPPADLHPSGEMVLLGLPVVVIEGGGWPHLEPRTRTAQAPRRRCGPSGGPGRPALRVVPEGAPRSGPAVAVALGPRRAS